MSKFINPFTDVGFKHIFGQEVSKPILLGFLNWLLEGERKIIDLQFLDKEQLGDGATDDDRSLIYDVYCELENGDHIIVEMQNKAHLRFKERSIYYMARSISKQGEKGVQWMYDVKATYLVAFLNFSLQDATPDFRVDVGLMDMKHKTLFSDKMRFVFLQLPMFNKDESECQNDLERMIYILKHMEILNRMPWAAQNAVFQKLASVAEVASLNKEERKKYDESLRKYRDTINVMESQFTEGVLSVARNLKQMNMPLDQIVSATGLSEKEIEAL